MNDFDRLAQGRVGNWIQLHSGRPFWPASPRASDIDIHDIAHGLSNLCRYGGHSNRFYSVAEHSVLVSYVVPPEHAMEGLLHDATEALGLVDLPKPVKDMLPEYHELEQTVWLAVAERFNLPANQTLAVREADMAVLLAEKPQLLEESPAPWSIPGKPADIGPLRCWSPKEAYLRFIQRYVELEAAR